MWSYINPRYVFRSLQWHLPLHDRVKLEHGYWWRERPWWEGIALIIALLALPSIASAQCVQSDGYPCIGQELDQYNQQQQQLQDQQYNQMLQDDTNQQIINQLNQLQDQ